MIVSKNVLEATPIITYICNISYIDPNTNGVEIKSKSQMSFSLSKSAPELSDCSINGDTVFKYNGEGALTSAKSITLTANLVNTSLKQWQYKKADGSFAVYPNSTTTTQLVVNATDDVFINDIAIIKLVTSDNDIYDIHQIVKLRDGAAGSATITCILSNDTQSVPCRTDGSLYDTSLNGCDTVISILKGADNDTSNWTITATPSTGVSGTYDSKGHKYTVTAITPDSGYVEFTCTRTGYATITKRFSINKDRSGSDGQDAVIYSVSSDVSFMQVNKNDVFVPSAITFTGKKIIGNNTATIYSGRFKIYESADGSTYSLKYTSTSDEQSKTYNIYLSQLYHEISHMHRYRKKRKTGEKEYISLVKHQLFYMDDIMLMSTNSKDIHKAVKQLIKYAKDKLGLEIKVDWFVSKIDVKDSDTQFIDMMGYRIYRWHTTIRRRTFKRIRRTFLKVKKLIGTHKAIPILWARRVISYWGQIINSDSNKINKKYNISKIVKICKKVVSNYGKGTFYGKATACPSYC